VKTSIAISLAWVGLANARALTSAEFVNKTGAEYNGEFVPGIEPSSVNRISFTAAVIVTVMLVVNTPPPGEIAGAEIPAAFTFVTTIASATNALTTVRAIHFREDPMRSKVLLDASTS
jgi:hypothetical protein